MAKVQYEDVLKKFEEMERNGNHVDDRLWNRIKPPRELYLITLNDESSYLSLIWQQIEDNSVLIPNNGIRTLDAVANQLIDEFGTFDRLINDSRLTEKQKKWFEVCLNIDKKFDISRFGWISIAESKECERYSSPNGTYYIYDGNHKALVLAKNILTKEYTFKPVKVLLLIPRPE